MKIQIELTQEEAIKLYNHITYFFTAGMVGIKDVTSFIYFLSNIQSQIAEPIEQMNKIWKELEERCVIK